ncbi:hypothetical protein D3C74_437690 [compost metagenome]
MSLWAIALAVSLVLLVLGHATYQAPATCGAGLLLGLVGLAWERRNRAEYRSPE